MTPPVLTNLDVVFLAALVPHAIMLAANIFTLRAQRKALMSVDLTGLQSEVSTTGVLVSALSTQAANSSDVTVQAGVEGVKTSLTEFNATLSTMLPSESASTVAEEPVQ